ncbi:AT-rich interactive domain-containing protein 4B isoform X2 [Planococcus citri]|uniref:AT-rich interactive domain-containing protein 4B isoform X2 n=1 Tax=Planococcus citri TaxID=170843 RepID=UPI0031F8C0DA
MHRWGNKKDMAGDDPPYLSVGTEVSAKYKGAFCEAKIRKVVKAVKCKVQYKNESGSAFVNDEQIKGVLMPGASVEVKQPDKKEYIEGTIVKIQDLSQYTVVFDDGDIATLRRTALCLKSGRHFAESETLDQLPLTHPEHFSTPVVSGIRGSRRRDDMEDNSDNESKRERKIEREEDMGKVVCVEVGDKKKSKDNWFPGLIVAPNAQDSVKIDVEDEYLVRSFKDGRYYTVPKRETVEFTREVGSKVDHPTLKMAVEKAISFLDKDDLPPHWDREVLFGMADYTSESDGSDTDSTDDEPREEKDHFVAQLYKFMDDRSTPINKGPVISSKDVDLYKLFKIVNKLGGYNRVTNRNQWKSVAIKLGYTASQTNNVKTSYKKFLHNFEDFYRKLGCTMMSPNVNNKLRSRSSRPLIRDRDKALPEKTADRDENNPNGDESLEGKELQNGVKTKLENQFKDETDTDDKQKELKKENIKVKKEPNVENVKEDDKTKKINVKVENVAAVKDAVILPTSSIITPKEPKPKVVKNDDVIEEKPSTEKKSERKVVKAVQKLDFSDTKKDEKIPKTKATKLKGVEKRIKKTEVLPGIRTKRSLKERMKAIVKKLKMKSGVSGSSEQDKKKPKSAEDMNKASPQLYKLKNKDDILNNSNAKTRKLSIGHDNRNLLGIGAGNGDRKSTSSSTSGGNTSDGGNSTGTTGKSRKTDEEGVEGPKKKTYTRKKKDEDKFLTSSADNLINQSIDIVSPYKTICVGDKLKVYYGPTHESKVTYEAKVMNKRYGPVTEYFVHYTGWNTRYDEWIRRSRIAEDLSWTPARDKLKYSQNDTPSSSQSSSQSDQTSLQSQTTTKTGTEKVKRSSISPVGKYPSKSINKVGTRQGRGAKSKSPSKFDVKGKKLKDSETSDESETESLKKRELQKTRSRTEKQKQQDEDTGSKDIPYQKTKKTPPLKRTRSGSLKSESKEEEPVKKRKVTPAKSAAKTSRTNAIRNSIMKNLVGRKRIADKGKKLFKKKDPSFDKESDDFDSKDTDKINESMEADDAKDLAELRIDIEKSRICEDLKLKTEEEIERMNCEETELVLKIKPFVTTGVVLEELPVSVDKAVGDSDREKSVEDESDDNGPPVLKKEVILDDEANASPISANLFLADSYLAENLEKQKLVKGKTKKDSEEKSPPSASKIFNRGSAEKSTVKANCDAKEKTFFPSRIDKVETKKVENTDKDKKDKLKNVNTFTSYLSMDKIDSIRKVNSLEKSPADKGSAEKSTSLQKSMDGGNELDIYEFKEPEPFEFRGIDDCPILHRRTATRLFDESPYKRPNKTSSSPGDSTKDEDFFKITDEMDLKSDKDESIEIDEKLVPKTAEPEKCEKLDSVDSTKIKETQNIDLEELDIAETSIEKSESLVEESNEIKISTILVSADSSSKDILKIDELNESTLYGDLPNEDDEDDDLEEEKLVISECDQPDDDISCESIASKSEVTVVFKDFDNLDRTLDSKLPDSSDKPTDLAEIDPKIEDVIKLKPSSSESIILSKSSASLPAKKDDNTGENVVSSSNKSIEDEISEKLHADENLDSEDDDDSVSSLKSGSSFGDTKTSKETGGSDSVSDDKDSEYPSSTESSGAAAIEPTKKPEHSRTLSSETITYSYKKKTTHETKCESDDTKMDTTSGDEAGESSEASKADLSHHSVIDEVEIEIFTAAKKEVSDQADSKSVTETPANKESDWQSEKASDKEENHHKNKEEDDDDGLLLCEETIPKSPEGKDPSGSHDHDLSYPGSSGMSGSLKKAPEKKMKRVQRPSVFPAPGTIFENTPPTTPEGSTPGNSPSDERNGFSSNSFSLNEKSSLNKDSSENDTYSDNSERSLRTKKYRDENGTCSKKNSYDYDSYLKRKSDKDSFYKNDEPSKKKGKQSMPTSANESERDDYSDEGQSPKSTSLSQKFTKSSYYLELDPDLDANQRIEVLEQKLQELRKAYLALKQELSSIDKRRKKLRRREREGRMMTRNEANSLL